MLGPKKVPGLASNWPVRSILLLVALLLSTAANAQPVTVTNVFQQHYHYNFPIGNQNCPSGYNIPPGQYSSTFHLERGHAIHHLDPQNAANDYWVYWAHFDNSSYGTAEVAIFKSTTECGPYILQTNLDTAHNTDGAGYGFQPGGWESRDEIIFRDSDQTNNADGSVASYASAYLITASNSRNTVRSSSGSTCSFANDSIAIFKMTPDYLGIDPTTSSSTNGANWVFVCDQREAPVMFRKDNRYFLITSQAAGWYPSQGGYGVSNGPLTGWTPDPIALGNTSTFGGQTSDGFVIAGTQANTYVLTFDHLGGSDNKSPSANEKFDTGEIWLPVTLDSTAGTATLNWYSSWTVDTTTGVLTLPSLPNLARAASVSSTVATSSGFPLTNANDGVYSTRWTSSISSSGAFNAAKSTTSTLCPVTAATTATTCNPSLVFDLGSVQPVQEIDLSHYMVKGSESYYTYKIAYSSDNNNWSTLDYTTVAGAANATANNISNVPFSNNLMYGFNALPVNFSARYIALIETGAVTQNNNSAPFNSFYVPNLFEMAIIQSTAPDLPQPVTVAVTPSTSSPGTNSSFTVGISVSGPTGQPVPTGYVQLSAPGYISQTYGLVNGANSFTIPAGATTGGPESITVSYRPDPTSAPVYGIGAITGSSMVTVSAPDTPTNFTVTQFSPGALEIAWTASIGAESYLIQRSSDGGSTYTQIAAPTTTSYVDTGLNNDSATYCYSVAAVNGAGAGLATSSVCSMATANFPVTGIAVTPSGPGGLTIAWTALANATGYNISRSVNGSAYNALTTVTAASYVDSGLNTDSTSYCYIVAAVFSTGTGVASSPVCGTPTTNFAPTGLQVTPWASGSLYLSWVASGNSTSYAVKRSLNGGAYSSVSTSQTALTFIDSGLTNYTSVYCYKVEDVLNGVASTDSVAVCNTPTANFLTIPNFSFETPSVQSALWATGPSSLPSSTASWTFVGSSGASSGNVSGISFNNTGTWTRGNGNAPNGSQVGYIVQGGSIAQTLSGFTPGNTYSVVVSASERQLTNTVANPFQITVNGTAVGSFAPLQSIGYYRDYSASFTATASSLSFALVGTGSNSTSAVLLDNIRIISASAGSLTITPQAASVIYGTSSVTLTATASFSPMTPPPNPLIFQVNGGDQTLGVCSTSGTVLTCTLTYSTALLPTGSYTINVLYAGDAGNATASASTTLTVAPANVTSGVRITSGALAYNPFTHLGSSTITATNTSSSAISGPLELVLAISNANVTANNANGTYGGNPYWKSAGLLAPGASIQFTVTFSYAFGVVFMTIPSFYLGGF
jgi:hypothetical protein